MSVGVVANAAMFAQKANAQARKTNLICIDPRWEGGGNQAENPIPAIGKMPQPGKGCLSVLTLRCGLKIAYRSRANSQVSYGILQEKLMR